MQIPLTLTLDQPLGYVCKAVRRQLDDIRQSGVGDHQIHGTLIMMDATLRPWKLLSHWTVVGVTDVEG